jgi:hypothetical protein
MANKRDFEGNRLHHFELSDANRTVRWVLIILLLVVAAVALAYGLTSALQTPAGWQTVEGNTTGLNCGDEFVLRYEYGAGDQSATAESKQLQQLYGACLEDAWKLFFNEAGETDLVGMAAINGHPNQQLTIDARLYRALEQMEESGSRALYLAPVYAEYDGVFYSRQDADAREQDPGLDEEQRNYVQMLADQIHADGAIELQLLGNNTVKLQLSEAYLAFAREREITCFVDFGWLRNAFIVDMIADAMVENGLTNGYIASVDGFTRNLDQRNNTYRLNLFHMGENGIDQAGVMDYSGPKSLVFLRSYPMYDESFHRYYCYEDGRIVTAMIDPADGQSKASVAELVSYSAEMGCGRLALTMMDAFVADVFPEDMVKGWAQQGIYSVWFQGIQLLHSQADLSVTPEEPYYSE